MFRVGISPLIWGILWGFLISLSMFDRRFLLPTNNDYLSWLQFFVDALSWFGVVFRPFLYLAWAYGCKYKGVILVQLAIQISLFMLSKLVLVPVPLITVGLAKAF